MTRLTHGPILPVLLSLALPNMLAMVAATTVGIAETVYVGALGREPLAAIAVVFPFAMLMQTFSAGAMGGAISSAISRAIGARDERQTGALVLHAVVIGLGAGLLFTLLFLAFGPAIYRLLGAQGAVLAETIAYSNVLFGGVVAVWLANTLMSILRGTGDMRLPSIIILITSVAQVLLGAALGLGVGPFPRWGMAGVALGLVLAYGSAAAFLLIHLCSGKAGVRLAWRGIELKQALFGRILRVGLLSCLSSLQTVLTVLIMTGLVARLGVDALAGYGIGARLEFLMIPIAFGVGVATVPMVGMAIGAGNVERARRVAWTGGALSAGIVGTIGFLLCLWPGLWAGLFTENAAILDHAHSYLRQAGPGYLFLGLGLTLYFASQGAGKVLGPVLAATLRLATVAIGGMLLTLAGAPPWAFFSLVAVAMTVYGLATAGSVWFADWSPARTAATGRPLA